MAKVSPLDESSDKKIGGYDGWEVRNAGDTLRSAEKIKSDSKFLKVVLTEMDRKADETEKTADVIRKTSTKLKKVFGNPFPHKKGGK